MLILMPDDAPRQLLQAINSMKLKKEDFETTVAKLNKEINAVRDERDSALKVRVQTYCYAFPPVGTLPICQTALSRGHQRDT
jgi:hypothetical protein